MGGNTGEQELTYPRPPYLDGRLPRLGEERIISIFVGVNELVDLPFHLSCLLSISGPHSQLWLFFPSTGASAHIQRQCHCVRRCPLALLQPPAAESRAEGNRGYIVPTCYIDRGEGPSVIIVPGLPNITTLAQLQALFVLVRALPCTKGEGGQDCGMYWSPGTSIGQLPVEATWCDAKPEA